MIPIINLSDAIGSDGATAVFTVELNLASLGDVTVQYRTIQDGTAVEGADYRRAEGTLTIPAGQTVGTISVDLGSNLGNDKDDTNFTLQLSDPFNAVLAGGEQTLTATGVELDDSGSTNDRALFVSDPVFLEGSEGTTQATFEVRLSESSTSPLNFAYTTVDGTAIAGQDYTAKSGTVSFAPGQTVTSVTVNIAEDIVIETAETFSLIVTPNSAIANGNLDAAGVATILDDDTPANVPVISLVATEGSDGDVAIFDVVLSESSFADVTVQYRTIQDGTAVEGADYRRTEGTLTIPAGQTVGTISVDLGSNLGNDKDDTNFTLQLSDPFNAVLAGGEQTLSATGVELDDSGSTNDRALFVSDPVFLEGSDGATQATFEVRLSEPPVTTLNFAYTTVDGTATAGQDYTAKSGTISFVPGQTVASVIVNISEDSVIETAETFSLIVTPNAAIATGFLDAGGIATILDDDTSSGLPVISLLATEGGDGDLAIFDVILSEPSITDVTVQYRTIQDGTAVEGSDYRKTEGTLTIPAGQTVGTISVDLGSNLGNDKDDTNFTLQLSDPFNAVLAGGEQTLTATGVELDDSGTTNDRALFVSDPTFLEGSDGVVKAVFEVRLSEASSQTLELAYTSVDGTAVDGEDYIGKSGTVTFLPGQTVASVSFNIIEDSIIESSETFSLIVTPDNTIANGVLDASGVATILNDDDGSIRGTAADEVLRGTTGDDFIFALGGDDRVTDSGGNDFVELGSGDDFVSVGGGRDSFYGGEGTDYISYYNSGGGVNVNLETGAASGSRATSDIVVGFEGMSGSNNGGDRIVGTSGANVIRSYGGDDSVYGGRGNDRIALGDGDDYVRAGGGAEAFYGGDGNDYISYINSSKGVEINLAANTADGSWASNDSIRGFEGVSGSRTGDDRITGTSGENIIRTSGGDDVVFGGGGGDTISLGSGDDFVRAGSGFNDYDGGSGRDTLSYSSTSRAVRIDLRDNEASGGSARGDTISGFERVTGSNGGDDKLLGTNGGNIIKGIAGDDILWGRDGTDKLYGGSGSDTLYGGEDTDFLFGGSGRDTFHFDKGNDRDVIKDFQNNADRIELDGFANDLDWRDYAEQKGDDVVVDFGGGDELTIEDVLIGQLGNDIFLI